MLMLSFSTMSRADDFPLEEYEKGVNVYLASIEGIAVDITSTVPTLDGKTTFFDESSFVSIPNHFRLKVATKQTTADQVSKVVKWHLLRPDGYITLRENEPGRFSFESLQKFSGVLIDANGTPLGELMHPICVVGGMSLLHIMNGKLHQTHVYKVLSFNRHVDDPGKAYAVHLSCWVNGSEGEKEIHFNDHWLITQETTTSKEGVARCAK